MNLRRLLAWAALPLIIVCVPLALTQEPSFHSPKDTILREAELTRTGARRTMVVRAIDRVKGSVVNIHSERNAPADPNDFPRRPNQPVRPVCGMGTGIIIDPRGYIVTNHHVVDDVTLLRCRLADGSTQMATVIARNIEADLAIIKIDAPTPLPVMPLGTATDLMVGETVIALGNAYGYEHTCSLGIVSAIKRDVSLNKDISYKSLIQTDASINPGNSGGPLVNVHGELVGVNVAIRAGAQGIGFAIPVDNMIRSVADMLRLRRRIDDGMVVADRLHETADGLVRSVVVEHLDKNSPSLLAGVKVGDVIVRMGDIPVACTYDFERAFIDRKLGDQIAMTVRRQDKEQRLDLVLANSDAIWTRLGMRLSSAPVEQVSQTNKQLHGGLEVTAVSDDGPAAKAGIRKGDVLVGLQQWETVNLENVTFVLNHRDFSAAQPITFYILRTGQIRRGTLQQAN